MVADKHIDVVYHIHRQTKNPGTQKPVASQLPRGRTTASGIPKNHHRPLRPLKQHWGNLGPASQPPLPSTSKSHKIKPIFITSSPHGSVESIPAFSQANGHPANHKNTPRPLTVINHSSLSQTQKPTSPKTILSNTNHHHHNKHCPLPLSLPILLSLTKNPVTANKPSHRIKPSLHPYCLH